MFNIKTVLSILVVPMIAMFTISDVQGAGKGASPNGKPFVELNGYIHEIEGEVSSIQDQIDSIVADVDTFEQRVTANEQAITDIQATNATLQAQIDANATDVASLETQIVDLNAANADLQSQIDALGDTDGSLQSQIDVNSALIITYTQSIDTLQGDLQAQIDNNTTLINVMQMEIDDINEFLSTTQQILDGQCPGGQFLKEIYPDGTIVCGEDLTGVSGVELQMQYQWHYHSLPAWQAKQVLEYCPSGWQAVSMGVYSSSNVNHFRRNTVHGWGGYARVYNDWRTTTAYWTNLVCQKLVIN